MKVSESIAAKGNSSIGEITWDACSECKHGSFLQEGCARKILLADMELHILYCGKFKDKNAAKYARRRRFRKKSKFNVYILPDIEQEGYE